MDFDPRDYDSRDEDRFNGAGTRVGRDTPDGIDCDGDSRQPAASRERDGDARTVGRGPGSSRQGSEADGDVRDRRDDVRWPDRERDTRERNDDVRDVFTRHVDLPRGAERELVRDRDRTYTLRGSEARTLATVGAFRVVSSRDLHDNHHRPADPRSGDLRHLREQKLIETVRVPGHREHAVVLTKHGRSLLENHRDRHQEPRQAFYAGLKRERELAHDIQVYRAYQEAAERLQERGARIDRVVLDYELKREYQKWLHERDRDRDDYDGRPDRTPEEIRDWAQEHELPYFDDEVHLPDARIEFEERDGRCDHHDIEVTTEHYRGAHAASVARSGFSCYGIRAGGNSGGGGGGRHGGLAEELWR